jgi:hypothetical protein
MERCFPELFFTQALYPASQHVTVLLRLSLDIFRQYLTVRECLGNHINARARVAYATSYRSIRFPLPLK